MTERRNRYENGIDFLYDYLAADVCAGMSGFSRSADDTENPVYLPSGWQLREVYMMNPDGSEQVNLTQHGADDQQAVWSPTGEQILFVSDRGGTRDLYLMDADGGNVRRVFKRKIEVWRTRPTWSRDSKQFAYQCVDWNFIKGGLYLGTFGEEDAEFIANYNTPEWSPDGSEIACSEHHPLGARLTFINIHTREEEQPLPDEALLFQFEIVLVSCGRQTCLCWKQASDTGHLG